MQYHIVDTFTGNGASGGRTAVCVLPDWPEDAALCSVAARLSAPCTTFLVPGESAYSLRWFAREGEVGNMKYTLTGAAFVLMENYGYASDTVSFDTKNGLFSVVRSGALFSLSLPAIEVLPYALRGDMVRSLGARPSKAYMGRDLVFLFDSEAEIAALRPDFEKLAALPEGFGVFAAAKGAQTDIAARAFWPKIGINEDTVCGSMYANLAPLFAKRLHKSELSARQLSARGGLLQLRVDGGTVTLSGSVSPVSTGETTL